MRISLCFAAVFAAGWASAQTTPEEAKAKVCLAIEEQKLINLRYFDQMRTVEPHLIGYDSDGDLTISSWQLIGGSGVGWRDFHVAKASDLTVENKLFEGPRPGYNPNDKTISVFVCGFGDRSD